MDFIAASTQNFLGARQLPEIQELIDKGVAIELATWLPGKLQSVTVCDTAVTSVYANAAVAAEFAAYPGRPTSRTAMAATGID